MDDVYPWPMRATASRRLLCNLRRGYTVVRFKSDELVLGIRVKEVFERIPRVARIPIATAVNGSIGALCVVCDCGEACIVSLCASI